MNTFQAIENAGGKPNYATDSAKSFLIETIEDRLRLYNSYSSDHQPSLKFILSEKTVLESVKNQLIDSLL